MATKTITTSVTLHVPSTDPDNKHVPFEFDATGSRKSGHYAVEERPPGTEVTLDEKEANAILKRFGGTVVEKDGNKVEVAPALQAPRVAGDVGKPGGPKA